MDRVRRRLRNVEADAARGAIWLSSSTRTDALPVLLIILLLAGCGSFPRPDRVVEPDVIGIVTDADFPIEGPAVVQTVDQTLEFDRGSAVELGRGGIATDDLLVYGEDLGRTWYASFSTSNTGPPHCYVVFFAAAFDEPGAVIFGFTEWRDVGLRLPKRDDFKPPEEGVSDETRQYLVGGESGGSPAQFCIDAGGLVFGVP